MPLIDFGREICGNFEISSRREWLVTNGIGGYAAGTVAGALTRRYHGYLLAALKPPLGRTLLVAKLNETVEFGGQVFPLFCDLKTQDDPAPRGYLYLERFFLEDTTPVWVYACAETLIEKRIWMQPGANTTYIQYSYTRSHRAAVPGDLENLNPKLKIKLQALVNYRDYHGKTRYYRCAGFQITPMRNGLKIIPAESGAIPFYIFSDSAKVTMITEWDCGYYLPAEAARGESEIEDHLIAGIFDAELAPGEKLTFVATTDPHPDLDGEAAYHMRRSHEAKLVTAAGLAENPSSPSPLTSIRNLPAYRQLILAADQFIVERPSLMEPEGNSIIAGYPWFSDWGRDTMISLPGLTLVTGRPEAARKILRTYAAYIDRGMLPNRFPDAGEEPEYNTIDATLWYFEALRQYVSLTGDTALLKELFSRLQEMITWHVQGTRYRIQVDPLDDLLRGGEPGVQLTWMDARVDDWVVTPRTGKPVEVNALWYNALRTMEWICQLLGVSSETYRLQAERTQTGFERFWAPELGYLYDVLDGPNGSDPSLRPNQLLAVSLHFSPLSKERQRAILDTCARFLLTSYGLRSLAPHAKAYIGRYGGTRYRRDAAYHQGTVWGWLIGSFVSAHLKVYQDPESALSFVLPLIQHLSDYGVGSLSEIYDGEPPHLPDGCFAQAWSVAEVLRALDEIGRFRLQSA